MFSFVRFVLVVVVAIVIFKTLVVIVAVVFVIFKTLAGWRGVAQRWRVRALPSVRWSRTANRRSPAPVLPVDRPA